MIETKVYKHKPLTIEAFIWPSEIQFADLPDWLQNKMAKGDAKILVPDELFEVHLALDTDFGIMRARPGDVVACTPNGGVYVWSAAGFAAAYEEA